MAEEKKSKILDAAFDRISGRSSEGKSSVFEKLSKPIDKVLGPIGEKVAMAGAVGTDVVGTTVKGSAGLLSGTYHRIQNFNKHSVFGPIELGVLEGMANLLSNDKGASAGCSYVVQGVQAEIENSYSAKQLNKRRYNALPVGGKFLDASNFRNESASKGGMSR